jgi:hypothetical protein
MSKRSRQANTRTATNAGPMIETFEERILFSTFVVSTTADTGTGSLRDAINKANKNAGADVIQFKIGSGLKTIAPKSSLPQVTGATTIDGTTQGGYAGKPLIEIRGDGAGSGSYGLVLTGGSSTVKGLIINRFGGTGILVVSKGGNTIKGCYIGTDATGSSDAGNKGKGIILQTAGNTVGGTGGAADRVVISGNDQGGIQFYTSAASGNKLLGSYVGTDATGTKGIQNGSSGVAIYQAPSNTIGGTTSGARNVISGNQTDGIVINGSGAKNNTILGNYIGTNAAGTAKLGNGNYGVEISQPNNTVGGSASGSRNVISGNKYSGVVLWLSSGGSCSVKGNYIGTDYTGMVDLGNSWRGIDISNGSSNNVIGGSTSAERNVIAGNDQDGILVYQGSNNLVTGNYIGLGSDGSKSLGNTEDGVSLPSAKSVTITNNRIGNSGGYAVNAATSSGTKMTANSIVNDTLYAIKQS